jgi:hypothetical protein
MRTKVLLTTAALAAIFVLAAPVSAATYYFHANGTGNWSDSSKWFQTDCGTGSTGIVPGDDDTAVICSGQTCNVDADDRVENVSVYGTLNVNNALTVDTAVTVQNGGTVTVTDELIVGGITVNTTATLTGTGTLDLRGTMTLHNDANIGTLEVEDTYTGLVDANGNAFTVTGNAGLQVTGTLRFLDAGTVEVSGGGNHVINGDFELEYPGSVFAITTADSSLTGSGNLIGEDNEALVTIADNYTLTNEITMKGMLEITDAGVSADATFDNRGTVEAERTGTLKLSVNVVEDTAGGDSLDNRWKVTNSAATLQFAQETNASLDGDFTVSSGTLDIQRTVSTTGEMSLTDKVQVAELMSFTASN